MIPFLARHRGKIGSFLLIGMIVEDLMSGDRPYKVDFEGPLEWGALIGLFLVGVGLVMRCWALGYCTKGRGLTTSGPYRFVRHPIYVGNTLAFLGFSLISHDLDNLILVVLYLLIVYGAAILHEEEGCRQQFGPLYLLYCQKVPALIPYRVFSSLSHYTTERFSWSRFRVNRGEEACIYTGLAFIALEVLNEFYFYA